MRAEVYKDVSNLTTSSDTFTAWNVRSKPWYFVIHNKGTISVRFDGPSMMTELDEALAPVAS